MQKKFEFESPVSNPVSSPVLYFGIDLTAFPLQKQTVISEIILKLLLHPFLQIESVCNQMKKMHAMSLPEIKTFTEKLSSGINAVFYTEEIGDLISEKLSRWESLNNFKMNASNYHQIFSIYPQLKNKIKLSPKMIVEVVSLKIKGQDEAIQKLVLFLYQFNLYLDNPKLSKPNPVRLLLGDSGVGKTFLVEELASLIGGGMEVVSIDCSKLSATGYIGLNLTSAIISGCNHLKNNKKVIIFLDEFDKLVSPLEVKSDVIYELLVLLNHTTKSISGNSSHDKNSPVIEFNIEHLCFILCGSFCKHSPKKNKPIGFVAANAAEEINHISSQDLALFGVPLELLGRVGGVIQLKTLTKAILWDILFHSSASPLNYYKAFFQQHEKEYSLSEAEAENIVEKALKRGLGARGLFSLLNEKMEEQMLDLLQLK